jgi:Family of unknown function (DUF6334)
MAPQDHLKSLCESGARFRRAMTYHFEAADHFISHIVLEFDGARLTLSAVADDDTLALSRMAPPGDAYEIRQSSIWSAASDRVLFQGWTLTNHQGYPDGVRLDFRNTASDSPVVFEAIVEASMIRVFRASEPG